MATETAKRCTLAKHHTGDHDATPKAGRKPCGAPVSGTVAPHSVETDAEVEQQILVYLGNRSEPLGTLMADCAGGDPDTRAQYLRILDSVLARGLVVLRLGRYERVRNLAPGDASEATSPPTEPAPASIPPVREPAPAFRRRSRAPLHIAPTETPEAHFARIMAEMRSDREAREATERGKGRGMSAPLEMPGRKAGDLDAGLAAEELLKEADRATRTGGALYETAIGRAYRVLLDRYHKEKAKPVQLGLFASIASATPSTASGTTPNALSNGANGPSTSSVPSSPIASGSTGA